MTFAQTLRAGEGQTVEFKQSLAERSDAVKTMVAFANSQGGRVFFGVKPNRALLGADIGANTLEGLAAFVRDHTYPSLPITIDHFQSTTVRPS